MRRPGRWQTCFYPRLGVDEVLRLLEVEVSAGLGGGEVKRRREELGPDQVSARPVDCMETIRASGFSMIEVCSSPSHLDYHNLSAVRRAGALISELGMDAFHDPPRTISTSLRWTQARAPKL